MADTPMTNGVVDEQIEDPFLQSVLKTSAAVKEQTLLMIDMVQAARNQGISGTTPELRRAEQKLRANLAVMRLYNRKLAHLVRDTKSTTAASRTDVDALHLNLQNLYYEQRHLHGEIASCEDFPNIYRQLPLISEDDFFEKFPEWVAKKEEPSDEHKGEQGLMRARILEEKRAREELEAKRTELVKRKMELVKENSKRKDELVKLDRDLEAFIEAAKPIQKTFEKEYAPV